MHKNVIQVHFHVFKMFFWKCTKMFFVNFQVYQNVIQVYFYVFKMYIFAHQDQAVQKGGKCSAMYFNLYSTFPSANCYPFHFTWFLLLLSVSHCHSSEHFAMDLATFQHILEERGLEGVAQRAQQHHADKWTTLFRTGDHEKEFVQLIDLALTVASMRKLFADGDVMMEAMLEAEYKCGIYKP